MKRPETSKLNKTSSLNQKILINQTNLLRDDRICLWRDKRIDTNQDIKVWLHGQVNVRGISMEKKVREN